MHLWSDFRHSLKASFEFGEVRRFTKFYPGSRAEAEARPREIARSSSPEVQARPRFSAPLPGAQDRAMPDAEFSNCRARCQGGSVRSTQLFAEEAVCGSLPQPKELDIYYRPNTKQSGLKLWIGELGCNVQRFPQRLVGRLIDSSGCERLREGSEKTRPVSANIRLKVSKPATSCFGCFLEAASPDKGIGQLGKAPAHSSPDRRD